MSFLALDHHFGLDIVSDPHGAASDCQRLLDPLSAIGGPQPRTYRVEDTGAELSLRWATDELIRTTEAGLLVATLSWHVNREAVARAGDDLVVHAGAVAIPGGGVVVVAGPSGAGKSTLVAALVARGWTYFSDELVALGPDGCVRAYPRAIGLRAGARRIAEAAGAAAIETHDGGLLVDARHLGRQAAVGSRATVTAIVFPHRGTSGSPTRVPNPDAVAALAAGSFNGVAHGVEGLLRLRSLVTAAPAWVVPANGLEAAAATVESLLA